MTAKKSPVSLVLATWRDKTPARNYANDGCGSEWLPLRVVNERDPNAYLTQSERVLDHIGVYVWFDDACTINLDLRLHDIPSMTEYECGLTYKALKSLRAKTLKSYPMLDGFVRGASLIDELAKLFAAMGVDMALQYNGIGQATTFATVYIALRHIAERLQKRIDAMAARAIQENPPCGTP